MSRPWLKTALFAVIAGVSLGGWLAVRSAARKKARRESECLALAKALDKTVRAKSPRYFEGIVEHRYDRAAGRCLAALEYHYKPCGAKKCAGPDADIAIYSFRDGGARPLFLCERTYATDTTRCTEWIYGNDGGLLSTRDLPPDRFPAIKAELVH